MNKSYRIDQDYIFVTDEKGEVRKTPKFEQIEEVLQIQNDLEAICILLDQKHNHIRQNNKRRFDISKLRFLHNFAIGFTVLSVGLTLLGVVSALGFGAAAISLLAVAFSGYCIDKEERAKASNEKLMANIYYLDEMKKQKEATLKALKSSINPQKKEQEDTEIVTKNKDIFAVIKEGLQMLQQMALEDASMSDIVAVTNVTQEVEKVKAIGSR